VRSTLSLSLSLSRRHHCGRSKEEAVQGSDVGSEEEAIDVRRQQ
jgi:hypothetical protein